MNIARLPLSLRRKQARGSILVNTAVALSLIVITLIGTEIGFMYFMKREFQKTADLAALAGAQQVRSGCTAAITAAQLNANGGSSSVGRNMPVGLLPLASAEVQCGYWDRVTSFRTPTSTESENAVRVSFQRNSPTLLSFFLGNRTIGVSAVAALGAPLAQFSVGSKLITVNGDSTLGWLLKGIGLDLSGTSLLTYDGLAQVKITPGGLLEALKIKVAADIGVGELNTLLAGRSVALGDLLDIIVTLAGQDSLIGSNVVLLKAIQTKLGLTNLMVQLGSLDNGPRGLFAHIISPGGSGTSALNVGVSALDLLYTSIGVATAQHAVDITSLNINLLSLAKVSVRASVIEPPSIAIGGIGAKAYNAQVRTFIHVTTDAGLLGSLLAPLVKLDLPIVLDAVQGTGTIVDMCTPALQDLVSGKDRVEFVVESKIANVCVGQIASTDLFSKSTVCNYPTTLQNMELINVMGLLKVNNHLDLGVLKATPDAHLTLAEGETGTTPVNNLQLGTLVSNLQAQLTALLFGGQAPSGTPTGTQLDNLTAQLWNNTASICTASNTTCWGQRYSSAINTIRQNAGQSGLLTGLLNGVSDLLSALFNECTSLLNHSEQGCKNMIRDALQSTSSGAGGVVSNAVSVLTGLLEPLLNAIGSSILTPLLTNVLGINLGQVDVNLRSLDCKGLPMLVY
ncbi:TadG family pilus assembly protein [Variovorax paradoxus]|uniref:TadG family pilus assembly protein n=1 Tax=Variovorax paradoxus TaxID=34073 RepID=UPI003ECC81E7